MCRYCEGIRDIFKNFDIKAIEEMEKKNVISLYAGDCFTNEIINHLEQEVHYTIQNYYQCNYCKVFFYIGFCVRGLPVYKEYTVLEERWLKSLWGKVGRYYSKNSQCP